MQMCQIELLILYNFYIMKRIEGFITYYVGDIVYSLSVEDVIHLDENENGDYSIDEIKTEDNVELAIKSEIKSHRVKGRLHNIKLCLKNGTIIAQADNFSKEYGNLKFTY